MTARIVLVEDHGLLAETVGSALRLRGHRVEVVDVTVDRDPASTTVGHAPDLALVDLDLGEGQEDGEHLCGRVSANGVRVVMVTGVRDPIRLARCVRAGAVGIVDKAAPFEHLVTAVESVLRDGTLLDDHVRQEHLALLRRHDAAESERLAPFRELTAREADVLQALGEGRSVDEIARADVVAVSTVRSQVRAILRKLGVNSQLAATALARRAAWFHDGR